MWATISRVVYSFASFFVLFSCAPLRWNVVAVTMPICWFPWNPLRYIRARIQCAWLASICSIKVVAVVILSVGMCQSSHDSTSWRARFGCHNYTKQTKRFRFMQKIILCLLQQRLCRNERAEQRENFLSLLYRHVITMFSCDASNVIVHVGIDGRSSRPNAFTFHACNHLSSFTSIYRSQIGMIEFDCSWSWPMLPNTLASVDLFSTHDFASKLDVVARSIALYVGFISGYGYGRPHIHPCSVLRFAWPRHISLHL